MHTCVIRKRSGGATIGTLGRAVRHSAIRAAGKAFHHDRLVEMCLLTAMLTTQGSTCSFFGVPEDA